MKLKKQATIEIKPTAPFNFDATFHKPDHFTSGDNYWEKGIKWQTWLWPSSAKGMEGEKEKTLGLKFINSGSVNKPKLKVNIYFTKKLSQSFLDSLVDEIKYRYNLDLDLTDFYKKLGNDPVLKPIFKKLRGMRPGHPSSLYEYLIIGIILQNATVKRSVQMFINLLETYGTKLEYDRKKLWCFWKESELVKVSEQQLRDLKVGYRAKSIKKIDDCFAKNAINEMDLREKGRETQMEELLKLYGVGPATVWYLLFDVFHHWDFFNHISPWEQKIYSKIFFDQDPENPAPVEKLLKHFERFGKYKQLAVHYIWEDLWWTRLQLLEQSGSGQERKNKNIPWLEKLIRM